MVLKLVKMDPSDGASEDEMINKYDTHFYVGTVHRYPDVWIIVGLFYPPRQTMGDLFGLRPPNGTVLDEKSAIVAAKISPHGCLAV
jgi:hypothetical protein